jgi:hypothetical protein
LSIPRLTLGLIAILGGLVLTASYVALIGDSGSYRGKLDPVTKEWIPNFSLDWFLFLTLLIATSFPMGGVWVLARFAYIGAIEPIGLKKVEGPDPVGQLLYEASQGRAGRDSD